MKRLDHYWYSKNAVATALLPLSWLFAGIAALRRFAFATGLKRQQRLGIPVIVVGNITVGGTGKTPLVIWLARFLREQGYHPGIVSRGYGGQARTWPQQVRVDSDPKVVGDEAILLARRTGCPMAVGPDRVLAARSLLDHTACDVIISDDGLQHYSLGRDIEVVVVDGVRRFGNGYFLPAGPLREPRSRLARADFVVANGLVGPGEILMKLEPGLLHNLANPQKTCRLEDFSGREVHGVAAIGHPDRFFKLLKKAGLAVQKHEFVDHYFYKPEDISFSDSLPVIMTEKDAVKCRQAPGEDYWYLSVDVVLDENFGNNLLDKLQTVAGLKQHHAATRQDYERLRSNG